MNWLQKIAYETKVWEKTNESGGFTLEDLDEVIAVFKKQGITKENTIWNVLFYDLKLDIDGD